MNQKQAQTAEAKSQLLEILHPGDKVYTTLRQVSRSGMSRHISVLVIDATRPGEIAEKDNGQPREISHLVARLLDMKRNDRDGGIIISGCGMDMGFEIVYNVGRMLFPDGFGIMGEASLYPLGIRPGTKAHADDLRGHGVQFHGRNGDTSGWDNDGGYALKQTWL